MRGWIRFAPPILILVALGIYCAFPHPIHDETTLKAVAAEAQRLMAAHPIKPGGQPLDMPKDEWPSAIASLDPYSVTVWSGTVDIATEPYFDGGWGYGFALEKQNLPMLPDCWSHLGHGVYWHGPC